MKAIIATKCLPAMALLLALGIAQAGAAEDPPSAFAHRVEAAFLKSGISMDVFVDRKGPPVTLIFWGLWTKARVYQVAWEANVLEQAKAAGFKAVDFVDKGPDGRWTFDLSQAAVPTCDVRRRVCR